MSKKATGAKCTLVKTTSYKWRAETFTLNKNCLAKYLIYKATVKTDNTIKIYIGSTSTTFKDRCRNHKAISNNKHKRYSNELSNYLWELKDKNTKYNLNFEMLSRTKTKQ